MSSILKISILPISLSVLIFLSWTGLSSRTFLEGHNVVKIQRPSEAYNLWAKNHIRGRVLLYFTRDLSIEKAFIESISERFKMMESFNTMQNYKMPIKDSNIILVSFYNKVLRQIYYIVPESLWDDVKVELGRYEFIHFNGKDFSFTIDGIPIIVTTLSYISLKEKVLIYINEYDMELYDRQQLDSFLNNKEISDLVLILKK